METEKETGGSEISREIFSTAEKMLDSQKGPSPMKLFIYLQFIYLFIFYHGHVVCLIICPYPLSKQFLHRVQSNASSFHFQYILLSLRSSSSYLSLFPRIPIPATFPAIKCFRRQFLRKV